MLDLFKIAFKNLRGKKLRSWLTLVGIFIGIAAVVSLIGLGSGLQNAITSQFGSASTDLLTIQAGGLTNAGPPGSGVINPLTLDDAKAISQLPDVDMAIPRLVSTMKVEFNDRLMIIFSISMPDGRQRTFVEENQDLVVKSGRLLKDGDSDKVVLGSNFDSNTNVFLKKINIGDKITINDKKLEVVGILKKRGSFIVDSAAFINEAKQRDLIGNKNNADLIAVKVKDKNKIDKTANEIENLLRKRRNVKVGDEDFTVQTPAAALATLKQIIFGIEIFVYIIASISVIVGALGIINTMLTAVLERTNQIGIMKAIGAKNSDIFFLFFFESGLLGLVGGIIGVIIGTLASYSGTLAINGLIGSSSNPSISFPLIFFALLGSFLIGSAAGIVPALRAARKHPVDALRG